MEGLYSERRYLGEVREFRKYNGVSGRIWKRDYKRGDKESMNKKREGEIIKSGGRGV